ncbi:hypothetical protein BH11PAT2_BH11PAT2_03880 [soil metagenome]
MPLGNGSTLAILGITPMESEVLERFTDDDDQPYKEGWWVYLVANIVCTSAHADPARVIELHARAIETRIKYYRRRVVIPCGDVTRLQPLNADGWQRVLFRNWVFGPIRNPLRYLQATADDITKNCWDPLRYAEWEYNPEHNTVLDRFRGTCPIKPYFINLSPIRLGDWTSDDRIANRNGSKPRGLPLGFPTPEAEVVAIEFLRTAKMRSGWSSQPGDWHSDEGGWRSEARVNIRRSEFQEGLKSLLENDYLVAAGDEFCFCEKFVVQCWRASIGDVPTSDWWENGYPKAWPRLFKYDGAEMFV